MNDEERRLVSRLGKRRGAKGLTPGALRAFRAFIYRFYKRYGRALPWRETRDPYHIFVSEIMLQQTPVERVLPKYREFVAAFPDFGSLARAPLGDVVAVWKGLGYNRRALALKRTAERVVEDYGGRLPERPELLEGFPGVGGATARSIAAFAFNAPSVFIETNIRTVFIHFFFPGTDSVRDSEIAPLVEAACDRADPRSWYSALMDYGTMLKREGRGAGRRSSHYRKQPRFEGSRRQMRGRVLGALLETSRLTADGIARLLGIDEAGATEILRGLKGDGLVAERGRRYRIP